ncbi:minor tail protein [Microbacterium phage Schubert]|uniref:Minor tail protein n=1 Tax=Microbacterium phage Schubert TaxID=2500787 RepID=A0A3Q9RAC8_9CAUD|nr:minor tail protein [Microbacterium phage Schubert]AZV01725.1 minor tail protein [Microbacterium phage Schubert]
MSFKLGTFDSDNIEGFKAILTAWPMLPNEIHLDDLPAGDGALYYRSRMTQTEWEFRLEVTGTDLSDVLAKADQISQALNPKMHGLQDFTPNPHEGWTWKGVLAGPVSWERDQVLWFSDQGVSRLHGSATVATPNPYGYAAVSAVSLSAPGALALAAGGNTSFLPTIEFRGVLSSSQSFSAGGTTVTGPLTASQTLVLDFENLDFYIKNTSTGAKVRNVADRITEFERLEGVGSLNVPVSISGGTFTQAVGRVNARKI